MYENLQGIGGFAFSYYWTSFEYLATTAWFQTFTNGIQYEYTKNTTGYVRPVRAF